MFFSEKGQVKIRANTKIISKGLLGTIMLPSGLSIVSISALSAPAKFCGGTAKRVTEISLFNLCKKSAYAALPEEIV